MKKFIQAIALLAFCCCGNLETAPASPTQAATVKEVESINAVTSDQSTESPVDAATVWVCKSAGAKKYHFNKDCGGLGRCKHTIEAMTVDDAEAVGLERCGLKKCNDR